MKSVHRIFAITVVAFAAVCANAIPAAAQVACRGSFSLSHEIQWQRATLPAGDYTFEIKSFAPPAALKLIGPHGNQFIFALVANEQKSERSKLIVERINGSDAAYVRELVLSDAGLSLRYGVPKAPKGMEVASAPTREEILVAVNSTK